jgi:predicted alpha/beta-hydrolase family hydrolase
VPGLKEGAAPLTFAVSLRQGGHVSAIKYSPSPLPAGKAVRLLLAHGAGANQRHAFMVQVARGLAERGIETTTFNFPYTEGGRIAPDPAAELEQCFEDVLDFVRQRAGGESFFLGGKSMGGRMASHLAAAGVPGIRGLVLLGYPLHPPGKPEQLRSAHLPKIEVPMLIVQGARDAFGGADEVRGVLAGIGVRTTIVPVEGGDHSFHVPKRAGQTNEQVLSGVLDAAKDFMMSAP